MNDPNTTYTNPFEVITPENIGIDDLNELFVDDLDEFKMLLNVGHMMLKGPRGVGKSMMFRYMQVDRMCSGSDERVLSELKFLGFRIPLKNVSLPRVIEFQRLGTTYAAELFEEHLLVSSFAQIIFNDLLNLRSAERTISKISVESLHDYYVNVFLPLFASKEDHNSIDRTYCGILSSIVNKIKIEYKTASDYVKNLVTRTVLPEYSGSFFNYIEFLYPLLNGLREVKGFPNCPIYLMVDDAHWLNELQTQILNSWIATRTQQRVSIKVSTQYSYKTYYTVTGGTIDTPHDYKQIDMSDIYTANARKGRLQKTGGAGSV